MIRQRLRVVAVTLVLATAVGGCGADKHDGPVVAAESSSAAPPATATPTTDPQVAVRLAKSLITQADLPTGFVFLDKYATANLQPLPNGCATLEAVTSAVPQGLPAAKAVLRDGDNGPVVVHVVRVADDRQSEAEFEALPEALAGCRSFQSKNTDGTIWNVTGSTLVLPKMGLSSVAASFILTQGEDKVGFSVVLVRLAGGVMTMSVISGDQTVSDWLVSLAAQRAVSRYQGP